ncbi:hypothetical protein BCV69DRAFT_314370 [Microstroma glucosiphilum]|uniref:Man1/Src1 C-terminal domain-containing protein n=1 Tax=Pseudomicrostroma glucosiphilum TaxID=1684307 RepID=A0A316U061_9BASI|nr:hypothetical protein BCV69DRAFT_314370 [Pseudomicrostroma glucosiphilum]PWN18809.1 hypothetical protein BCV69DRAFT_314370 [Pseudomicrostroma glucosiphilum]
MPPTPSTPSRVVDPADPDFTASDLRVPELRSLLATRNIRLPTSARKPALVKAVEETFGTPGQTRGNFAKQEEEEDEAGNFSDQNVFQTGSGNEASPKPRGGVNKARKSAGAELSTRKTTKVKDEAPAARRKTIDPSSLASSSARKPTSSVPQAPSLPSSRSVSSVFQNYMDPIVAKATPPRKVTDGVNGTLRKTSGAVKRMTSTITGNFDSPDEGADADVSGLADDVEDSEEDEEDEVEDETPSKARGRRRPLVSSKRKRPMSTNSAPSAAAVLRWLATAALIGWWIYYVRDSKTIGYCDIASDSNALLETRIDDYDRRRHIRDHASADDEADSVLLMDLVPNAIRPGCTPCPPHALCAGGDLRSCLSDEYIHRPSLWSSVPILRSLLPLQWQSERCHTDSRRLEMIDELAGEIARQLGNWRGAVTCGSRPQPEVASLIATIGQREDLSLSEEDKASLKFAAREEQLFQALLDLRDEAAVSSEEYFSHLWDSAIEELETEGLAKRLTVSTQPRESNSEASSSQDSIVLLLPAASLAVIPLGCRLRLALRSLFRATFLYIVAALSAALALLYTRNRLRRSRFESHKIDELTTEVLQRLAEQQMVSLHSNAQPSHLPANHLRDLMLPAARGVSAVVRKSIWSGVSKQVESNSNVRVGMKKWKGEYSRCWEWVGVVTPGYGGGTSGASSPAPGTPHGGDKMINGSAEEGGEGEGSEPVEEMVQSKGSRRVSYGLN